MAMTVHASRLRADEVEHLRAWRCGGCNRIIFRHRELLEEIARAAGLLEHKCACNSVSVLPKMLVHEHLRHQGE